MRGSVTYYLHSKNVTLGIPQLKEIINIATKIKTPLLSVYLESDIAEETQSLLARNVQQELAYTSSYRDGSCGNLV